MNQSKILASILLCFFITACSSNDNIEDSKTIMEDNTEASSLFDIVWQLQEYTDINGSLANVSNETKYQFLFESEVNTAQAFIGCVNFSESTYFVSDGFINLTLGASDAVLCINQTEPFLDQNRAIMSLISGGEQNGSVPLMYSLVDEKLKLQSADGRVLNFIQTPELMLQE